MSQSIQSNTQKEMREGGIIQLEKKGGGLYIRMEEQHVFPRHSTKQAL